MKRKLAFLLVLLFMVSLIPVCALAETVQTVELSGPLSVAVGKKVTLKATVTPKNATNKKLTWTSSDPQIATVSTKGQVKGISKGTVTITAATQDGTVTSAPYTVEVKPVTKRVTFEKNGISGMKPGDTQALKAIAYDTKGNILEDAKIEWKSSNANAVTVDENGLITAVANGKATVTASYDKKKVSLKITVAVPKPLKVSCAGIKDGVLNDKYGMRGTQYDNGIPSLSIPIKVQSLPKGAKSLAIVMTDPDGGNWVHWLAANVSVKGLKENASIKSASSMVQGNNTFGTFGYGGPTPPSGVHTYVITVYALSDKLSLNNGFTLSELTSAMSGLVLSECTITGSYAS